MLKLHYLEVFTRMVIRSPTEILLLVLWFPALFTSVHSEFRTWKYFSSVTEQIDLEKIISGIPVFIQMALTSPDLNSTMKSKAI